MGSWTGLQVGGRPPICSTAYRIKSRSGVCAYLVGRCAADAGHLHGQEPALRRELPDRCLPGHFDVVDRRHQRPVPMVGRGSRSGLRRAGDFYPGAGRAWHGGRGRRPTSRSPPPGRSDSWHCVGSSTGPWISAGRHSVGATRHGVVPTDPTSGGGKVGRFDLVEEARRRGMEPVVLGPGDDLSQLAEAAVHRGADALGMAGGDGSQAVVARVAAAHGLPFVCVPAGTRNHFALDLGIDRNAPVAALDAFGRGRETTIDLGEVNGEVFVNNVSLGLLRADVVACRSTSHREAKGRTVAEVLPDLLLGRMLRQRGSASTDLKVRSPVRRSSRCPTIRTAWRASVASDRAPRSTRGCSAWRHSPSIDRPTSTGSSHWKRPVGSIVMTVGANGRPTRSR